MTDNEIIKALECCSSEFECHNGCPYYNNGEFKCRDLSLYKDTLDLINRQKAEIKGLNKEVDRLSQVVLYNDGVTEMKVEEAKAEARKEFAEVLKEKTSYAKDVFDYTEKLVVDVEEIDNTLKEMEGK